MQAFCRPSSVFVGNKRVYVSSFTKYLAPLAYMVHLFLFSFLLGVIYHLELFSRQNFRLWRSVKNYFFLLRLNIMCSGNPNKKKFYYLVSFSLCIN